MRDTAVVLTLLGIVIAVLAWMSGRWRGARAARSGVASINSGVRGAVLKRGISTGRFGSWLYAQRVLVRIVLGALAIVWLMLLRPLSVGEVFLVLIVWLVVWWVFELLQRRPDEVARAEAELDAAAAEADTDVLGDVDTADADTVVIVDATSDPDADTLVIEPDAATETAAAPRSKKRP